MLKNRKGSKKYKSKKPTRLTYDIDNAGNFKEVKESNKSMFDALKDEGHFRGRKSKKLK